MHVKDRIAVLVVDDDEAIRQVLCDVLEDEGFVAFAVETHAEARAVIARETVSLILLDTTDRGVSLSPHMPFADPHPPVVLFSAADGLEARATAMRADGWLAKPFAVDELFATISTYARA
jgi:two-component system OmpR family response regulator